MIVNENQQSAPSLKNLTDKNYGKPPNKQNEVRGTSIYINTIVLIRGRVVLLTGDGGPDTCF